MFMTFVKNSYFYTIGSALERLEHYIWKIEH